MGKRSKVTTRDIAEYTGLSQSTVSMILSGRQGVSFMPETRETVMNAARELGYKKPQKAAPASETDLKDTILLLAPLLSNSYYTSIIHSITEQAALYNYDVLTAVTFRQEDRESQYLSLGRTGRLAGIIILYPISRITEANALSKDTPMVMIGEKPDRIRFDSIELDSKKPGWLVADHLLSLGHRHMAFVSSPIRKHEISRARRLEGIQLAFRDRGLDESLVEVFQPSPKEFEKYPRQSPEYQIGYDMAKKALAASPAITAFIGQNDMTAYGILSSLRESGYLIPRDYSVAGFDDSIMSSMPQISLTTVEHAAVQKGKDAVDLIYNKNKKQQGRSPITRMEYEPRLILRNTTGPLRTRKKEDRA